MENHTRQESFSVFSRETEETAGYAEITASFLRPGDVILLTGDLAAGKTYFVKALAKALGCADLVTSPTYAIVNTYNTNSGNLLHIDVFRLSGLAEFRDLGLDEYFPESITVVEWGDMLSEEFSDYLLIAFDRGGSNENDRKLTFSCRGARWISEMPILRNKLSGFGQ